MKLCLYVGLLQFWGVFFFLFLILILNFSSVQLISPVRLFVTLWTAACQASLSITNSQSPPKPMSIESLMPSNHIILCSPLLLLPSIFPSIRVFSNESWNIAAAAAKSLQSCPTLCEPIDGSPPGSSIPGILQARTVSHKKWDLAICVNQHRWT